MSSDLEEQLDEMGPEYRKVVARLKNAREADFRRETLDMGRRGLMPEVFRLKSYLTAASLLVFVGIGVVFLGRKDVRPEAQDSGFGPREYRASVAEMIATQNPDGSWQNDFLTRRNAAALKVCGDPAARIAYKKAVRNLRSRGML